MRPVSKGSLPKDSDGHSIQFKDYSFARRLLIERIGQYCSYCEMKLDSSLHVEHVKPKQPKGIEEVIQERLLDWDNFLLACVNCNSNKGSEEITLEDYFWPDQDNTFKVLKYSEGGVISPVDKLEDKEKDKALRTIKLTGLDKNPKNDPKASDRRWENRREVWGIAQRAKERLKRIDIPEMRDQIVSTATGHAYWSVWMTVFQDDADMLARFIEAFSGTCRECFDAENNYISVERGH